MSQPFAAIFRLLYGNTEAADEVYQEFCLKFVKGGFHRANPDQGQFRRFVKRSLYHLIVDHARKQKRVGVEKGFDVDELDGGEPSVSVESDREFITAWREQLLSRTWTALAEADQPTGRGYCELLRFRVDHPDLRSSELAEAYAAHAGKEITAGNMRVKLHRAPRMLRGSTDPGGATVAGYRLARRIGGGIDRTRPDEALPRCRQAPS